jgi:hypothetical protein
LASSYRNGDGDARALSTMCVDGVRDRDTTETTRMAPRLFHCTCSAAQSSSNSSIEVDCCKAIHFFPSKMSSTSMSYVYILEIDVALL